MTENKKIFLDTAPFICFLDNNPHYAEKMMRIFDSFLLNNAPDLVRGFSGGIPGLSAAHKQPGEGKCFL